MWFMDISLEAVKKRLCETKGSWPEVARGASVDYFTVCRIGSGKSKSPRYDTIKKLAHYFSEQEARQ